MPVLNTFKIITFPHDEHRSNMTEYSFYCTTALDTRMQRRDKEYVATRKWSVRMPIVLPMQK